MSHSLLQRSPDRVHTPGMQFFGNSKVATGVRRAAGKWNAVLALALGAAALPLAAQTVEQWQQDAVRRYPALAQAGSPFNQRFLAIVAEKRKSEPGFFARPDWPVRAADAVAAAIKAEEDAVKAADAARLAKMSPDEQEWEKTKERWFFEKLAFGDDEATIAKKLYTSKTLTARVPAVSRMELDARFQWVMGDSKFRLAFEAKDGLAAVILQSPPQQSDALDSLINDDWGKLRAAAIERFGPPVHSVEFPVEAKLQRGGWTVTDTWERADARIKLGIISDGGKCSAGLRISDPKTAAE